MIETQVNTIARKPDGQYKLSSAQWVWTVVG